jgi:tetrapyrrole methylase family protein/MazG family protein
MIYIVGLGPGDPLGLPPRAFALLTSGLPVLVRTLRHPIWESGPLAEARARVDPVGLDEEYERRGTFDETYDAIVARVLDAASERGDIVYAVPGHPLVGETTVARLLAAAKERGAAVKVVGAPSFVDACLEAVAESVTGDLHVVDALSLDPEDAAPAEVLRASGPVLLYQVHSRDAASRAKLSLMRAGYPDEWPVTVLRAAGVPGLESVRQTPLYALDRGDPAPDHLTSVWVPALPDEQRRPGFAGLVRVMARLRHPENGCPWDLKQTHATLRKYLIEEAYEVIEAIDAQEEAPNEADPDTLCEELGDLLLQVVFHAQLSAEEGVFDAEDVCQAIVDKLIRRHPHIFGEVKVSGAEDVLTNWNAIKAQEKGKEERESVLDGIPRGLPAMSLALETSKRAVRVGFEWPEVGGVLDKVEEEFAELRAEIEAGAAADRVSSELGDLLFTLVNIGRKLGVDVEEALRAQVARFGRRFRYIEAGARASSRAVDALSLEEMEALWQEAKRHEKRQENRDEQHRA